MTPGGAPAQETFKPKYTVACSIIRAWKRTPRLNPWKARFRFIGWVACARRFRRISY